MSTTKINVRPKMIGKTKAAELIEKHGHRFFSGICATADDPNRSFVCRKGVTKGLSSNPKRRAVNVSTIGMVRVYDMLKKDYITLNLQTLKSLKIAGGNYRILQSKAK